MMKLALLSTILSSPLCYGFVVAEPRCRRLSRRMTSSWSLSSSSLLLSKTTDPPGGEQNGESSPDSCQTSWITSRTTRTTTTTHQWSRRQSLLGASLALASTTLTRTTTLPAQAFPTAAAATTAAVATTTTIETQNAVDNNNNNNELNYNLNCLLDLPRHDPTTHLRLYLCRHGQTENNRLGQIQGARINPSLNRTGQLQAMRLGQAFNRLLPQQQLPEMMFHSNLVRAQETASTAAAAAAAAVVGSQQQQPVVAPRLQILPALAEVDFGGTLEGEPVEQFRSRMKETYSKWAHGLVEERMGSDGESARDIYSRMETALATLMAAASVSDTGSVAAISHSAYLKMLLAAVSTNASLLQVSTLEQKNCCINVLDVSREGAAQWLLLLNKNNESFNRYSSGGGGGSLLLAGAFSTSSSSSSSLMSPWSPLTIPQVQRINEKRHLTGLV